MKAIAFRFFHVIERVEDRQARYDPPAAKLRAQRLETAIGVRRSIELRHDVGVTESG